MATAEGADPDRQSAPDVFAMLRDAVSLHQRGRMAEAESGYLSVLMAEPGHGHAQRLLGVLRCQQGRNAEALDLIDGALKADPGDAEAHANRGNVLLALQRLDEAVSSYDAAIALDPDDASTHYNRGSVLLGMGRPDEAAASFDTAIALEPAFAQAHCNRGNALLALGRAGEALASYDRAVAVEPDDAVTRFNRGNALMRLLRHAEAVTSYETAIALRPAYPEAHSNRGNALMQLKRTEEALASFDLAIALNPALIDPHANRGNALLALNRAQEALASYDRAVTLDPDRAVLHANRGNALLAIGRAEAALDCFARAVELEPDFAEAHFNRGNALKEMQRFAEAMASYEAALALDPRHSYALGTAAECAMKLCDWGWRERHQQDLHRQIAGRTAIVAPFLALVHFDDPALQLRCVGGWIDDQIRIPPRPRPPRPAWRGDRIRLAYLSADFRRHATAYLIAELIERHDRQRFEVIGLSYGPDDDSDMRAWLAGTFDRFVDVAASSDGEVAELIDVDRIDIAVDLMGHTRYARPGILADRPAPVQATYLGFPGTTGAGFIDYIIADPIVAPFDRQPDFSERIVHLPDCYQANDRSRAIAARTPTRRESGLPAKGFVFCCFNTSWKIAPAVFDVWMRLLRAIPDSVLWLLRDNPDAEARLRKEATLRGIEPARLVFADRLAPDRHLARHRLADLFLDTLPYNAHTTASDALWAGLPLLTCRGDTFAARVAASLLEAAGLPELVTSSLEDYERLALRLAGDEALCRQFRTRLQADRLTCPLFDSARFCRHIEAAYLTMWELWQRGESPRSFAVASSDVRAAM